MDKLQPVRDRVIRHDRRDLIPRVEHLNEVIEKVLKPLIPLDASILQIGSACGYMLETFQVNGYTNLTAIDKDPELEIPDRVKFVNETARQALSHLPKHDVVFTHKFLYILPPEKKSEDLMDTIANSFTKYLITMEEEGGTMGRVEPNIVYWNRNYQQVFESRGLTQIWTHQGSIQDVVFRIYERTH